MGHAARILIVEDNPMNRDVLSRVLGREGHEILVADNGLDAVAIAKSECPDLIVMDISLPKLDGHEATRLIRSHPEIARVPIVALTANAREEDRDAAFAAGVDAFDVKPVDVPRFLKTISALLAR